MSPRLVPSEDLGLRHVLQNGLSLVRREQVDPSRRERILARLIEIFSEADQGAAALQSNNLIFAVEQHPAFERFSVFFRYLKDSDADVPKSLSEANSVLRELRTGDISDEIRRRKLEELLERLIKALKRERSLTPLIAPKNFNYS